MEAAGLTRGPRGGGARSSCSRNGTDAFTLAVGPLPIASVIGASPWPCRWPLLPSICAPAPFASACGALCCRAPLSLRSRCASSGFRGGRFDSSRECRCRGSLSRPSGNGSGWPECSSIHHRSSCASSGFRQSLPYVLPTTLIKAWRNFSYNATSSHSEGRSLKQTSLG